MYKLTVIAGSNRGSTFAVGDGQLSIGRQAGNTIVLPSSKVSKKHCVVELIHQEVIVKDLESSNGTFVNGALIQTRKIKSGDHISVGEFVFELVLTVENKNIPSLAGLGNFVHFPSQDQKFIDSPILTGIDGNGIGLISHDQPPSDIKGKILWAFEYRLMPLFYSLIYKHEWNIVCIFLFSIFVLGNLVITVYPLLESNKISIIKETKRRARFMARQIADQNSPYLAARAETKTEIGLAENAEGVRVALLVSMDNRILAPGSKLNQYLTSGIEAVIAVKARNRFESGQEVGFSTETDSDLIVAVEPVKVTSPVLGKNIVVAMAIVSIDTTLSTPDIGEIGVVYSEALILTSILGGIILLILYRITLKPLEVLNEDMDKALKGNLSQVTQDFKFYELNPLWEIINSAIQRISNSESSGLNGLGISQDASQIVAEFVGPLSMIGNNMKNSFAVFNGDKKIVFLNSSFEELTGIRNDGAVGQEIIEVARDQAMGAFAQDILSRAKPGDEGVSEDFDFSGTTYKVTVAAFGVSAGVAKCFVLIVSQLEG